MITRETVILRIQVGYSNLTNAPVAYTLAERLQSAAEGIPGVVRATADVVMHKLEGDRGETVESPLKGAQLIHHTASGGWRIQGADAKPMPWPPVFPDRTTMGHEQASELARALGMSCTTLPR